MSNIFTNNMITRLAISSSSEMLLVATVLIILLIITLCKIIFILERREVEL